MSSPMYLDTPNTLEADDAAHIATQYGFALSDVKADLHQANTYSQTRMTRPDTQGNGLGKFLSAEDLFKGYLQDRGEEEKAATAEAESNDCR